MNKPETVLITGVTGLVGSYLLKMLLANGYKVYALARSKDNKSAEDRVVETLKFWDKNIADEKAGNLKVLEGDITRENLGLDTKDISTLINGLEEVYHSAAVTQYNWPSEKIRVINVAGTRNVLELSLACNKKGRLRKVAHISTAYVCGDYKGTFSEDDLDVGQGFQSTYLQSKFDAEIVVEEYREKGLWVDIFRPPLVVGESTSGKTITFQQSVYQLFHMWSLGIFDHFPGEGLLLNIVFVDELCNAIFKISSQTSLKSRNFNLFSNKTVPLEKIIEISNEFLGITKPELVSRSAFMENDSTPVQRMLLQNNILLFNENVRLESKKTNDVLNEFGFGFSSTDKSCFLKLLEYCAETGFLKKHHEKVPH